MTQDQPLTPPAVAPGLLVREATAADNDALITLELECPLLVGDVEETFDRSPDSFAFHRVQPGPRVVLAELDGRVIGVMAGVVHAPVIQGEPHRLVYIHQARVHPDLHHKGAAWAMAADLFAWSHGLGAEGPYLIAPGNERSIAFGGRAGRRWPVDLTLLELDVSEAREDHAAGVPADRLGEAAELVNRTHAGEEFFEPLTSDSIADRTHRDSLYALQDYYGVFEGEALVAAAGLWDRGATVERRHFDRTAGVTTRARGAVVVDWGWAPGREEAFAGLLRSLAAKARALGRTALTICEPSAGAVPDCGLPAKRGAVCLFTPAMDPPPAESVRGLFFDLLYL